MSVVLRPATPEDCTFVWETNNDPSYRALSFSSEPIPWDGHVTWYARALEQASRQLFIIIDEGAPAGVLRLDFDDDGATITVVLIPEARGRGLGRRAVHAGTRQAFKSHDKVYALALSHNAPSRRMFISLGYTEISEDTVHGKLAVKMVCTPQTLS